MTSSRLLNSQQGLYESGSAVKALTEVGAAQVSFDILLSEQ